MLQAVAEEEGIDLDKPFAKLTAKQKKLVLHGREGAMLARSAPWMVAARSRPAITVEPTSL